MALKSADQYISSLTSILAANQSVTGVTTTNDPIKNLANAITQTVLNILADAEVQVSSFIVESGQKVTTPNGPGTVTTPGNISGPTNLI